MSSPNASRVVSSETANVLPSSSSFQKESPFIAEPSPMSGEDFVILDV